MWPCPFCNEIYVTKQLFGREAEVMSRLESHVERDHTDQEESDSDDTISGMVEDKKGKSRASSSLKPTPEREVWRGG